MDEHGLDILHYEAYLRTYKPRCSGCLDMNPAIFDWRAVPWATSYPSLDPQKIVSGARNQCKACVWASLEGPIQFSRAQRFTNDEAEQSITDHIEVISAECMPSSLDPLGTVSTGRLVIKGQGRSARLEHSEDCEGELTRHYSVRRLDFNRSSIRSNFFVDNQPVNVDYDLIERGFMKANSGMDIYCLHVGSVSFKRRVLHHEQGTASLKQTYRVWRLLLHCVGGTIFERVGLQEYEYHNEKEFLLHKSLEDCTITIV